MPLTTATITATSTVAQTDADAYKAQRLHKAAHQFEAMMLGEMLKPLTQTGEDALNGSDSSNSGPLQSFGVEAVAGSLSNSDALGFAKQIEHALSRSKAEHASTTFGSGVDPSGSGREHTKV